MRPVRWTRDEDAVNASSKKFQLTTQQRKCLALDRNVSVIAGAGSGKTGVLVERYLSILRTTNLEVDNIVAITFTRKAAAEMLNRVRQSVNELLRERTADRERWARIREDLSRANIGTIHSFCERLLRQYPLEVGIDPAFEVIDPLDAEILRGEAIDEALFAIAGEERKSPGRQSLERLLAAYGRYYLEKCLETLLGNRRTAGPWLERIAALDDEGAMEILTDAIIAPQREAIRKLLDDTELLRSLKAIAAMRPVDEEDDGYKLVHSAEDDIGHLSGDMDVADAADSLAFIIKTFTTADNTAYKRFPGAARKWPKGLCAEFKRMAVHISRKLAPYADVVTGGPGDEDIISVPLFRDFRTLLRRLVEKYEEKKGGGMRLEFEDLEGLASRLLHDSPASGRICEALRRRFRYVMVDEFQDTNRAQWRIIEPLVSDSSGRIGRDRAFIVGDPKQSIYGFRNADVRVLSDVARRLRLANSGSAAQRPPLPEEPSGTEDTEGIIDIPDNFRSLPCPIDFVNHVFSKLMPARTEGFEVGHARMSGVRGGGGGPTGLVEILCSPANSSDQDADSLHAEMVAGKIREIVRGRRHKVFVKRDLDGRELNAYMPATYGNIAILLRRRNNIHLYEHFLSAYGVPYVVHKGIGFFQRQEVLDLHNVLRFLSNELDEIALAGVLRSPMFGLSDEGLYRLCRVRRDGLWRRLLDADPAEFTEADRNPLRDAQRFIPRWRDAADRLAAADLLHTILDDTGYLGSIRGGLDGEVAVANVDKLLEIVRAAQRGGVDSLRKLTARLQQLCEREGREGLAQLEVEGADAVRVMTIHAAKGLEFPIVFLPELHVPFDWGRSPAVHVDEDLGLGISVPVGEKKGQLEPTGLRKSVQRWNRRKEHAESKRLLYVGMTRARDELYLATAWPIPGRSENRCWASGLFDALDIGPSEVERGSVSFVVKDSGRNRTLRITSSDDIAEDRAQEPKDPAYLSDLPESADVSALESLYRSLAFIEEERLMPVFSVSSIMEYRNCPARYFYQYVMRLPEDLYRGSGTSASGGYSRAVGNIAHALLEDLTELSKISGGGLVERALSLARSELEIDPEEVKSAADRAAALVAKFRSGSGALAPLFDRLLNADDRKVEMPFLLRVDSCAVDGRVDLLCRHGESYSIVDYKTGGGNAHKTLDELPENYEQQMRIYALAVSKLFPCRSPIRAHVVFLAEETERELKFDERELEGIERELRGYLQEMRTLYREKVTLGERPSCANCGYRGVLSCREIGPFTAERRSRAAGG